MTSLLGWTTAYGGAIRTLSKSHKAPASPPQAAPPPLTTTARALSNCVVGSEPRDMRLAQLAAKSLSHGPTQLRLGNTARVCVLCRKRPSRHFFLDFNRGFASQKASFATKSRRENSFKRGEQKETL